MAHEQGRFGPRAEAVPQGDLLSGDERRRETPQGRRRPVGEAPASGAKPSHGPGPYRPASEEYAEELENATFMLGPERGSLTVALDLLTDALTTTGAHAIHCRHPRQQGEPSEDVRTIVRKIEHAKELIQKAAASIEGK